MVKDIFSIQKNEDEYCDCCGKKIVCPKPPPKPCPAKPTKLSGLQMQLVQAADLVTEDGANVLFNMVISQPSPDISYDSMTGEFLLPAGKNYYISWWVVTNGTETVSSVEFTVVVDEIFIAVGASPLVTGQLSGSALITGKAGISVLSLRNTSNDRIRYAKTSVQAGLVIVEMI